MNADELSEVLAQCFEERGFEPEHGRRLGEFCAELSREQARGLLLGFLDKLRSTRVGAALYIACGGEESIAGASRRLRCSKGSMHALVREFTAALDADARTARVDSEE